MFSTSSTFTAPSDSTRNTWASTPGLFWCRTDSTWVAEAPGQPVDAVRRDAGLEKAVHDADHFVGDGDLGLIGRGADVVGSVDPGRPGERRT